MRRSILDPYWWITWAATPDSELYARVKSTWSFTSYISPRPSWLTFLEIGLLLSPDPPPSFASSPPSGPAEVGGAAADVASPPAAETA